MFIIQSVICHPFTTMLNGIVGDEQHGRKVRKQKTPPKRGSKLVGERGFEPPTHWSQTSCATKLRYSPMYCFFTFYFNPANRNSSGGIQKTPPWRGPKLVGERGFEPPTHWSQTSCATKLRYSPLYCFFEFLVQLIKSWCEGGDSNPHILRTLTPEASASTNSATFAFHNFK